VFITPALGWEYIFRDRSDTEDEAFGKYIEGIRDQNQDGYDDILVMVG